MQLSSRYFMTSKVFLCYTHVSIVIKYKKKKKSNEERYLSLSSQRKNGFAKET